MKSFRDMNPYIIGLVSIAVIAVATAAAFFVGLRHVLEDAYPVSAVFSDAAGIRTGDDVRLAGVEVGRVTGVRADRQAGTVVVDMVVNDGIDLGPETHAEIALQTLLGTKFVRLSGPVREPFLADLPEARRRIPRERTKTPFDVFELTRIGTRTVEQTDTEKLNQFIKQLADVTEGKEESVARLLDGIDRVSRALNDREAELRRLFDRAEQLSGVLADKDRTLVDLIDTSQGVLTFVERRSDEVSRSLGAASGSVAELARLLSANKEELDRILTDLHPTLELLSRHEQTLNNSLGFLGQGGLGLAKASSHGPWQDIYVQSLGPDIVCALRAQRGLPC